jgi:hypothetical protein
MSSTDDQSHTTDDVARAEQDTTAAAGEGTRADRAGNGGNGRQSGWVRAAKRYGPFVVVAAVIAAVVAVVGGGDDGDDGGGEAASSELSSDVEELILSGPMTPQRAELEGVTDVDFGPNCDLETGRITLPSVYAPPCVEPFEGDNGGATSQGVTEDEVLVVMYQGDPALNPLQAATVESAGADVDPATTRAAIDNFVELYNDLFETYGRTVRVEFFTGTGAPSDAVAARADAVAIAEMEPFAVVGGPTQQGSVFSTELANRGVVCMATCPLAVPDEIREENYPYIWSNGGTPTQTAMLTAEMIGKLAGPGPAELAGDPAMQQQDRVYAVVHFDSPEGDYEASFSALEEGLADQGIELETDIEFFLDLAVAQENARTIITQLKDAGVTTVIYTGDPFTPGPLTTEATAQDYFPEWILGQSVLADTTIFGRLTDQQQWQNGFGISLISARGERSTDGAFLIYEWATGEEPPNNTVNVSEPPLRAVFTGIHMAGPELTPDAFRDALYRNPPAGGGPTNAQISRGFYDFWPGEDLGGADDMALIWWDPEATGEDEVGNEGQGMYRYANGGQRYTPGEIPDTLEEAGLFDVESSVTVYDEIPPEDQVNLDYPLPGGPYG